MAKKVDALRTIIPCNADILICCETKIDYSYPTSQFLIEGFSKPYRKDRNRNGGGILFYIREDIPSKLLNDHNFPDGVEVLFLEVNLRKSKWLVFGTYHPPSQRDEYYFDSLTKAIDIYLEKYDKFLLAGDFNAEDVEPSLDSFLYKYEAKYLSKIKTVSKV